MKPIERFFFHPVVEGTLPKDGISECNVPPWWIAIPETRKTFAFIFGSRPIFSGYWILVLGSILSFVPTYTIHGIFAPIAQKTSKDKETNGSGKSHMGTVRDGWGGIVISWRCVWSWITKNPKKARSIHWNGIFILNPPTSHCNPNKRDKLSGWTSSFGQVGQATPPRDSKEPIRSYIFTHKFNQIYHKSQPFIYVGIYIYYPQYPLAERIKVFPRL